MGRITCGGVLDSTNLKDPELQAVEAWSPLKIFKANRNDNSNVISLDAYRAKKFGGNVISLAEYRAARAAA